MGDAAPVWAAWLQFELPRLHSLRGPVAASLSDPDREVRMAAIEAVAALEYDFTRPPGHVMDSLSPVVARILANRYRVEPDPIARARIVNVFAYFSIHKGIEAVSVAVLDSALSDPHPSVVQTAVLGVGMQHVTALLPKVVRLLAHQDFALRNSVASAIGEVGAHASKYLPDLQAALATESNAMTRKSLQGAITRVTR